MNTCWKCSSPLRVPTAAYCPVCGSPQQRDDPAGQARWTDRLEQSQNRPNWALSLLWLLAFPLAPITYPFLLLSARGKMRRHVRARLASPAMMAPRFTQTPEGRAIIRRLNDSTGRFTTGGALSMLASLFLLAVCCFALFVVPASAPNRIGYERAVEAVLEASPARGFVYIDSEAEYDDLWESYEIWSYDDVVVQTTSFGSHSRRNDSSLPRWNGGYRSDTGSDHRPYEYLGRQTYRSSRDDNWRYERVNSVVLYWNGTEGAGVVFYLCLGLLYLLYLVTGLMFWFRFARHAEAEVLAASYAAGDPQLHDRLMPIVRQRNALLTLVMLPLLLTGLHVVLFPILRSIVFARHAGWERRSNTLASLGLGPRYGS